MGAWSMYLNQQKFWLIGTQRQWSGNVWKMAGRMFPGVLSFVFIILFYFILVCLHSSSSSKMCCRKLLYRVKVLRHWPENLELMYVLKQPAADQICKSSSWLWEILCCVQEFNCHLIQEGPHHGLQFIEISEVLE